VFTQNFRFFKEESETVLLERVAKVVESIKPRPEPNEYLDDPSHLRNRIAQATKKA
jgi:hypothetical protein